MIQPVKNFVKISDYYSFILRQSVMWNELNIFFVKELDTLNEFNTSSTLNVKHWFNENKAELPTKESIQKNKEDLANKLLTIRQRLELLKAEYNRVEYYLLYKFDQIELPPELSSTFFEFIVQEMKSQINYH